MNKPARLRYLRRILLGMAGHPAEPLDTNTLSARDWACLDAMALQHRIAPYLHARLQSDEATIAPPPGIRASWQAAHRASALSALAHRRTLLQIAGLLRELGVTPVVLKGAWAAWRLYPSAAARPVRDIDILLSEAEALAAFHHLEACGFRQEARSDGDPEAALAKRKHLPPLVSSSGIRLELHTRLWERSEEMGWFMPPDIARAALHNARTDPDEPSIRFLDPDHQLDHWIVHAVYSNRLNGGPLGLIDIDLLLQDRHFDWREFWTRARRGQWAQGAAFLFHLIDRWRRPGTLEQTQCVIAVPPRVLEDAPDLLLQDLGARKTIGLMTGLAHAWSRSGPTGLLRLARERVRTKNGQRMPVDGADAEAAAASFRLAKRAGEILTDVARADVRATGRDAARLGSFLEPGSCT